MLKSSLLLKKNTNFMGEKLKELKMQNFTWINSRWQEYEDKRNERPNVLVFENSFSVYTKEYC